MIRKRDLIRRVPIVSRLARRMDDLEAEIRRLRRYLWESTVVDLSTQRERGGGAAAEWPVPPGILRYLASGTDDVDWFLESGRLGMLTVVDALERNGVALGTVRDILDFGCGCGRVTRHLDGRFTGRLHGADRNPVAVEWCRKHLPFASFEVCPPEPPTPYADATLDAICAFSVFTHLGPAAEGAWIREMRRLLQDGGVLKVTLHGDSYRGHLPTREGEQYDRGEAVLLVDDVEGSNLFNAFHPEAYVRGAFSNGFAVVDFVPAGARGNPTQDLYVLRKS